MSPACLFVAVLLAGSVFGYGAGAVRIGQDPSDAEEPPKKKPRGEELRTLLTYSLRPSLV